MKRGQISFDLVLAVTIMLIFMLSLANFRDEFTKDQEELSIRAQQKQIGSAIVKLLANEKKISGFGHVISYNIPKISVLGSNPIECGLNAVLPNTITITVDSSHYQKLAAAGTTIKTNVYSVVPITSSIVTDISSAKCGGELTLSS
ncbi:MAG: hypothetical protein J4224_01800 [Candidatus Diapherotrites archaeon]|uniref:Uncharacterized protein n=1 Tax=Candidatus Iainarchaeum sp. TaxID=3101447 RepID=A0A7J4IWN4_9ARCH|nr:MAG: hypothetical protein QT03_C0001G1205 [archaeon GW2011_AR10]MBS3059139.1 hypothetical protein [Candidatus Diapherotrites archaeon]HIH08177.1 hypothetical protein [Candidatus Diapherotrites archaeon]